MWGPKLTVFPGPNTDTELGTGHFTENTTKPQDPWGWDEGCDHGPRDSDLSRHTPVSHAHTELALVTAGPGM